MAVTARADPDKAPNRVASTMTKKYRRPFIRPISVSRASKMTSIEPDRNSNSPISTNSTMVVRVSEVTVLYTLLANMPKPALPISQKVPRTLTVRKAIKIGTPRANKPISNVRAMPSEIYHSMLKPPVARYHHERAPQTMHGAGSTRRY